MVERGSYTLAEILSQPQVWQDTFNTFDQNAAALRQFFDHITFNQVIFTGCGSTYYLALMGASLFQSLTGIPAVARPASELVFFPEVIYAATTKPLLITVSRSGTTSETVEAARRFRERTGANVLVITCDANSILAQEGDFVLSATTAQEDSVAQTRSFSSMAVLVEAVSALVAGRDDAAGLSGLVAACDRLIPTYHDLARRLGEDRSIERFFFLGTGWQYGIACEAMLKMKEMSLSYSEAYHILEFRHGPMSMVNEKSLVVGLVSEQAATHETAVLKEMQQRGAHVLAIMEQDAFTQADFNDVVALNSNMPAWARPILYLPALQLMAYYRAIANGKNPDRPENLFAAIHLDNLR